MTLAFGRDYLAIPGPSVTPDRVQRAMHRAAPNIYEGELIDLTHSVIRDLKAIAHFSGDVGIYIGNGHAAWEASICNIFSRGDKALGLSTGRFGTGWIQMAEALGVEVQTLDFGHHSPADVAQIEAALRADSQHKIKAVMTVQTDTASSVTNDIAAIRKAIDAAGHPALLMIDCIASFGCEPLYMDDMGVDLMVTGCQKGLMTPPGLSFLFFGEKCWAAHATANLNTPYWNCKLRVEPVIYADHFCGTAPTHHLYALREALDMLLEEGIENTWKRHQCLANCVWAAVEAWSKGSQLRCNIKDAQHRSLAVTTVLTSDGVAPALRRWCEETCGVTLGIGLSFVPGQGPATDMFRIGHMGHLSPAMLLGALACIEAGLIALEVEHGAGAVDAAAKVIADFSTKGE